MTLLREVIDIPLQAHDSDFVLSLTEGIEERADTLRQYVVTDDINRAFDRGLGLVEAAVTSGRSRAAFVHGSFGSGKSHYMAVLHALLGGNPAARAIAGLAEPIARHDGALQGRSFLRLAYHLIGANSLEQALFNGYLSQVRRIHPSAVLPQLHHTDALFDDAAGMRRELGDERFLDRLNGATADDVWGRILTRWTPESYDRAASAPPDDRNRARLADALVRTFFKGYTRTATYVDIDSGLREMSRHAGELGYDGIVLFLDELVLWLVSRSSVQGFVTTEGAKVAKLVESADARRPIPLMSFIARQRDVRDFLGETGPGAQQVAISDTFRWWEDRFEAIRLGDENLPYVVQKRLLQPRDEHARQMLDEAFSRLDHRPEVWNTLLDGFNTSDSHRGADEEAFRRTYPFSPALVSTLRAVSSAMQRERTALKVMQQILVDQRDELTVDDVVAVGAVFDRVVEGQNALDPAIERQFANARRLYHDKIRPALLAQHHLSEEEAAAQARNTPFGADDGLAKTLLLSALVPAVPALQHLTASRLAALNHGTIASPLPDQEATVVLHKVRQWQQDVPEIDIGEGNNPTITVRLADVDYRSVLDRVLGVDTPGARLPLLKKLVLESFGIAYDPTVFTIQRHPVVWRASRRELEVAFGNVFDATSIRDDVLDHDGANWRLVIDFPYDERQSRSDHLARLERFGTSPARTVVWIPRFFTTARVADLRLLVQLDYLLEGTGERFNDNSDHLSQTDRGQARSLLESMRSGARRRLQDAIQQAYGARAPDPKDVEIPTGDTRVLRTLDSSLPFQEPVGGNLQEALENLKDQLYSYTFPEHPKFPGAPLKLAELRTVLEYVGRAHEDETGRVPVTDLRARPVLARVCNPLRLGEMFENAYVLNLGSNFPWFNEITRRMAADEVSGPVAVAQLRRWLDQDQRRGLDPQVANLVIAAWAILTDRTWYDQHGAPILPPPSLDAIRPEMELKEQELPSPDAWANANRRASELFGISRPNVHVTAANVGAFVADVRRRSLEQTGPARELCQALQSHAELLGLDAAATDGRLATAIESVRLLQEIARAGDATGVVSVLDQINLPSPDLVVARSLSRGAAVAGALNHAPWIQIEALQRIHDDRAPRAAALLDDLRTAARADEFHAELEPVLRASVREATELLAASVTSPAVTPLRLAEGLGSSEGTVVLPADQIDGVMVQLGAFARRHPGKNIRVRWWIADD